MTVGVTVGVAVGVDSTGAGVGFAAATATPLFQTSFLPLFTHVNFLPEAVTVWPDFLQALPALGAVAAWDAVAISTMERMKGINRNGLDIPRA